MEQSLKNKGWDQMRGMLDKEMPVKSDSTIPLLLKVAVSSGCIILILAGIVLQPRPWENNPSIIPKVAGEFPDEHAARSEEAKTKFIPENDWLEANINSGLITTQALEHAGQFQETEVRNSIDEPTSHQAYHVIQYSPLHFENEKFEESNRIRSLNQSDISEPDIMDALTGRAVNTISSGDAINSLLYNHPPSILTLNDIKIDPSNIMIIPNPLVIKANNPFSNCKSSWALGLHYKNNGQHNLHGLGLGIMRSNDLSNRWFISYGANLTYFVFNKSKSLDDFMELSGWDSSLASSQTNEFLYRTTPKTLLGAYWETGMALNAGFYFLPKLSVHGGLGMEYAFRTNASSSKNLRAQFSGSGDWENQESTYPPQYYFNGLIKPFHFTAGVGFAYELNCRFSAGIEYHWQLTHFWQSDVFRNRSKKGNFQLNLKVHF